MTDDLELRDLDKYYGTEAYHSLKPLFTTKMTDGVAYVYNNGYAWAITDSLALIEGAKKQRRTEKELSKLIEYFNKGEDFLAIKLKLKDKGAIITIEDGNNKVLHKQIYKITTAKRELTMYVVDGIILLSGEY